MSIEPATQNDKGYCDPADVAEFFDRFDDGFGTNTTPTASRVEKKISRKASKIDRFTGHAWRERRMVDEMHNLRGPYRWNSGLELSLTRRDIRTPLDASKGDKLEFWDGNEYTNLVTDGSYSEGRDEDYWFEESTGTIYVRRRRTFFNRHREMKITYRFGKEKVPGAIAEANAKLVAADLMETDFYRYTTPGNDEAPDAERIAEQYREQVWNDLEPFKEIRGQGMDF